jgi:hypothetical protein
MEDVCELQTQIYKWNGTLIKAIKVREEIDCSSHKLGALVG